jgi:Rad3-related DNA helicase
VYLPDKSIANELSFPGETQNPKDLTDWHHHIAHRSFTITKKATGGALILCNSYDDIKALADRLRPLKSRLLVQQPDEVKL